MSDQSLAQYAKRPSNEKSRSRRFNLVHDLEQRFRKLSRTEDRQRRGYAFQALVSDLFRRCSFDVDANPPMAQPRQTDLFVKHREMELLVEVRWREREMDSNDIDSLYARLLRTPTGIVGCALSITGLNESAIRVIEENRSQREIVAFAPDEIFAIFEGRVGLLDLLGKKREILRRKGRAWFTPRVEADVPRASLLDLPYARDRIWVEGTSDRDFWSSTTYRGAFVFAKSIPDTRYNGPDAALRLNVGDGSIERIANLLHFLNTCFGLSSDAVFTIHQTGAVWTGFGVRDLLTALPRWRSRYSSAGLKDPHYSEELVLFSPCGAGWGLVTAQHITHSGTYHYGEVELRLPGVPVDPTPFRAFCDAVGASPAFFTATADSDHRRTFFNRGKGPRLKTVRLVVDRHAGDDWVTGLIVENPFRLGTPSVRKKDRLTDVLPELRAPAHLYVKLTHHHLAADVVDYYEITGVEAVTMSARPVLEIRANWNRLLKSTWRERHRSAKDDQDWAKAAMRAARAVTRPRSKRSGRFLLR
jgi:hypothetical protein